MRTHCDCGAPLPTPPAEGTGDWGDWYCPKCLQGYCQDCGSRLDYNDECLAFNAFVADERYETDLALGITGVLTSVEREMVYG